MRALFHITLSSALAISPLTATLATDSPSAQSVPQTEADVYDDLYSSMQEGVDEAKTLENVLDTIIKTLEIELPQLALLEDRRPGTMGKLRSEIRPVMIEYSLRVKAEYRPRMVAVLRDRLTLDEARSVAAFYRSELGKKLLAGVSQNYDLDSTIQSAAKNPDKPIDAKDLATDLNRTGIQAYLTLTKQEREELDFLALNTPGLVKLIASQSEMTAVRTEMENAPLTAGEQDRFNQILKSTFDEGSQLTN